MLRLYKRFFGLTNVLVNIYIKNSAGSRLFSLLIFNFLLDQSDIFSLFLPGPTAAGPAYYV